MLKLPSRRMTGQTVCSMVWAPLFHTALFMVAVGLCIEFRSGVPLLILGVSVLALLFRMNYGAVLAQAEQQAKREEGREVAKLKFEAALRTNRVTGAGPESVLAATMEAVAHGVTQQELTDISDRVGGEHGEHLRRDEGA